MSLAMEKIAILAETEPVTCLLANDTFLSGLSV